MANSLTAELQPFDHLVERAGQTPSGSFFHDRHTSMTYSEALTSAVRVAGVMRELGVRPGDTVALDLPASLHLVFVVAVFHEAAISSMVSPVTKTLPGGARPFVADWMFSAHVDSSPLARRTVHVDRQLMRHVEEMPRSLEPIRYPSSSSVCRVVHSSGTTGHPKPVAFTVEMTDYRARCAAGFWMHTRPFMSLLDVGTVSGFQTFYASLMTGESYVVPGDAGHNVEMLQRHGIASIKASPAQIAALVRELRERPVDLPELKIIQFAGAMLPASVARAARETTRARIYNLYGSTETGTISARYEDSDDAHDMGTVTDGSEVEIVDDDHRPVPVGSVGRIRYRRPLQATGYLEDPEATADSFVDGWFYPGDLGRLTADGRLRLEGRVSEIINVGGTKIDPARVDAVACEIPGVRDAAGFSHLDGNGMTQFVLAVVIDDDFDALGTVQSLTDVFGAASPSVIVAIPQIPRNAMGKPMRVELGMWYAERATSLDNS